MVVEVENPRETGPGGQVLIPASVAALGFEQVFDAVLDAEAGGIAAGDQPQNGPGGLRRRAGPGGEDVVDAPWMAGHLTMTQSDYGITTSDEQPFWEVGAGLGG